MDDEDQEGLRGWQQKQHPFGPTTSIQKRPKHKPRETFTINEYGLITMLEEFPAITIKIDDDSFTCYDLVKCMFRLSETEISIIKAMNELEALTAMDVGGGSAEIGPQPTGPWKNSSQLALSTRNVAAGKAVGTPTTTSRSRERISLERLKSDLISAIQRSNQP